jgi:four helix bundle suffix protein
LIPVHGGYRNLTTFHISDLIYDVTVRFCRLYVDPRSRTYDQMVQAARSGKQNIAEASIDSGTSRKSELKLTNIARGSLEELRLDYKDFLRDRGLAEWAPNHPALMRFKAKRCATLQEVRDWANEERALAHLFTRGQKVENSAVSVRACPCPSVSSAQFVANAALSLLNICCYLLKRQLDSQAARFQAEGGFTERLYRVRSARRAHLDGTTNLVR